jgi:N-acetylmuramoyl-L-alanine amidase
VVRLTIYASKPDALDNIHLEPKANTLFVSLAASSDQNLKAPPLPTQAGSYSFLDNTSAAAGKTEMQGSEHNVIQSATFRDGALMLVGQNGSTLAVKNQFTLSGPKRLVIDLANTVLAEKSMTTPIDVSSGPIRSIRLGQFDEDTVRIVVETPQPNGLYLVYPGEDKRQLTLSQSLSPSIRTLPAENQDVGFVQDVGLTHKDDASVIRINTSSPMVRRIVRRGNDIEVELINIAAKPSFVAYDKQEFADIKEIRLSPLNAQEPNSKVIIKLENPAMEMDSHLSLDGHTLEVSLTPRQQMASKFTRKMPTLIFPNGFLKQSSPGLPKGAFTVVVDAGHGGKDLGANREGVYEKQLNLSVALRLKQALEAKGITVYMTRATDKFLELSQICAITNSYRPDAFVSVHTSVHTNASVNASADGIETYYLTPQSRDLAFRVHRRAVNSVNSPDRGVRTARFYVIHHTNVPAILFEMGYISNPSERAALQSDTRQHATAEAIAEGVVEFLQRSMKAEAPQGDSF